MASDILQQPNATHVEYSTGSDHDHVIELSERVGFNMHDAYYEHATAQHFWIQWRFEVLQRLLATFNPGQKIFEVGCGNGVVQQQFESLLDLPVPGCDLNYHAMANSPPGRGQRFLYNVFDQRDEWRNHFETILLLDTLEHIEMPTQFLKAIANHLQPDGLLVINVPATPWLYSRYDKVQGHVRRYTFPQLESELESAGFKIQSHSYWGVNVVPIAAIRKLLVTFAREDDVLTRGFAPPGKLAERLLRGLMKLELNGIRLPGTGTSLAAIAIRTS
ncbi:MAG: class I SAM-dependent methyltransferase [Planctomycetota bacterium]